MNDTPPLCRDLDFNSIRRKYGLMAHVPTVSFNMDDLSLPFHIIVPAHGMHAY